MALTAYRPLPVFDVCGNIGGLSALCVCGVLIGVGVLKKHQNHKLPFRACEAENFEP